MYTLNLVRPDKSAIQYEKTAFPDGQQSIKLGYLPGHISSPISIRIISRLNSFRDLELIICATQALREFNHINKISLTVPYFLGARSDRKFEEGTSNYLKTVICPIINSQNFAEIEVLDPHSDVLEACLNNFKKVNNFALVKYALTNIDNKDGAQNRIVLVSPDAGAYKKVFDVAKEFDIDKIITATKVRDVKTGKILRTELPNLHVADIDHELKYVIVDDICDGGRTFIELAKVIKERRPNAEVYLIVTHGIFSNGLLELSKYLTGIFCTNSISDIDAEEYSQYTVDKKFINQIDIF